MAQPLLHPTTPRSRSRRVQRSQLRGQGISLAELLIGVVIGAVVLGATIQALVSLIRGSNATQVELNRKDELGRTLGLMQDEIRNAQRIETGSTSSPLNRLDSSNCPTNGVQTILVLRGRSPNEDISYGLLNRSDSNWRGPSVLVRCGPTYNADGSLNAGTTTTPLRSEQILVDALKQDSTGQDNGFSATSLGGTGAVSRHVELTLRSNTAGVTPAVVQVPINSNQVYGLASSGNGTCADGSSLASGCLNPDGASKHYKPVLGGNSIVGTASLEDAFYFEGNKAEYSLSRTPGSGTCTHEQCTLRHGTTGQSITIFDADVLIFKDVEIRL